MCMGVKWGGYIWDEFWAVKSHTSIRRHEAMRTGSAIQQNFERQLKEFWVPSTATGSASIASCNDDAILMEL